VLKLILLKPILLATSKAEIAACSLVDVYVLNMEEESLKLIEVIHGTYEGLE
jgi:hypothetical protein